MRERYGFISVFSAYGDLLGYVPNIYKSRITYVRKWLDNSQKFYNWHHFVFWLDKQKEGVYYR